MRITLRTCFVVVRPGMLSTIAREKGDKYAGQCAFTMWTLRYGLRRLRQTERKKNESKKGCTPFVLEAVRLRVLSIDTGMCGERCRPEFGAINASDKVATTIKNGDMVQHRGFIDFQL